MGNGYKETQAPLIKHLWDLITADAGLKEAMQGTVRLHFGMALKDTPFPYLVHRIDNDYDPNGMVVSGTYYIDTWSYSKTHEEALKIRGELLRILDKRKFIVGDAICRVRMLLQTEGVIPEEVEKIQHRAAQFWMRYDRKVELEQILAR